MACKKQTPKHIVKTAHSGRETAYPDARSWTLRNPATLATLASVLTFLFVVVAGLLVQRHDLWRDEANPWVLARDSHSLRELLAYVPYEGHPPLWYLLLFIVSSVTQRPEAMQWLHVALAASTVFIAVRFAPFPWPAKLLFPFGYFTLFEYGIISRNYQLILLLIVVFCAIHERKPRAYVWIGIVLFLLCQSHVYGLILACALSLMVLLETAASNAGRLTQLQNPRGFLAGTLITLAGAALSILVLIPAPNMMLLRDWSWDVSRSHVLRTLSALWNAYVPIAPCQAHFWNITLLGEISKAWLGLAIGLLVMLSLRKSWPAAFVLGFGQFLILLFMQVKYFGYMRHHGTLFIAAIAAFWIALENKRSDEEQETGRSASIHRWLPQSVLAALLAVQAYAIWVPIRYCWRYPFSPGHAAARALERNLRPGEPVVVTLDGTVQSMSAYLPGWRFFFPWGQRWGTFAVYRKDFNLNWLMADNGLWWAAKMAREKNGSVLLVNPTPITPLPASVTALGQYDFGIVADEPQYLYRVSVGHSQSKNSD